MTLRTLDGKERVVLFASILLLLSVFGYAVYYRYNPPLRVKEAKVFDVILNEEHDTTQIWTYGEGRITLKGIHDVEVGEVYRITYKGRRESFADELISLEKIS
jgi:hypothetical protein